MYTIRQNRINSHTREKIREGTLVRIHSSPDIKVRIQDPVHGHLDEIEFYGDPLVGVVTKLWPSGHGARELEMISAGGIFILTSNNGLNIEEIEVLS